MRIISTDLFFRPAIKLRPQRQVENGDFYSILKRLADEKLIKADEIISSPRADTILKRVATVVIAALVVMVAVNLLILSVGK